MFSNKSESTLSNGTKRIYVLAVAFFVTISLTASTSTMAADNTGNISGGTQIKLRIEASLESGTNRNGEAVPITVAEDVRDRNGAVLIRKGERVEAVIKWSRKSGWFNTPARLEIRFVSTKAADGQAVALDAYKDNIQSKPLSTTDLIRMVFGHLDPGVIINMISNLILPGAQVKIAEGSTLLAYVHSNVSVVLGPPAKKTVLLKSGSSFAGTIAGPTDGYYTIETSYGILRIAVSEVVEVKDAPSPTVALLGGSVARE
jgi:hypothetical protein